MLNKDDLISVYVVVMGGLAWVDLYGSFKVVSGSGNWEYLPHVG